MVAACPKCNTKLKIDESSTTEDSVKFKCPKCGTVLRAQKPDTEAMVEKARRFARTIMSDIALYNANIIEDAIRNDTFFDIMGEEIREGAKLYNSRISPEVKGSGDYYREAIEDFLQKKREELGI